MEDEEEIKLTRDEAWAIAVERGFTGSKPKSLTDGMSRKGNAEKYKAKYGLIRVGSGSKAYYLDIWKSKKPNK